MPEMVKIVHNNYEKISDVCMWLSSEYVLKFNVELNRHNDKFGTVNYHKEIGYNMDGNFRVNINREFNYYLSIESLKKGNENRKLQLRIGVNDIYFLQYFLNRVVAWFTSEEYKSLYVKDNGKIIIPVKVDPIKIMIAYGNYIEFEPSVMRLDNGDQVIGVRVFLNSDGVSFFMNVNTLLAFTYFISNFNMYQSAQLMLNYISRPNNGTNYFGMNDTVAQQPMSFFDRVNANRNN